MKNGQNDWSLVLAAVKVSFFAIPLPAESSHDELCCKKRQPGDFDRPIHIIMSFVF